MEISQPTLENRNGIITGYTIAVTQAADGAITTHVTSEVNQSFTVTSLHPYTIYFYTVAAHTVNGTGPPSVRSSITTAEAGM